MKRLLSLFLSLALLLGAPAHADNKTFAELDPLSSVADGDIVPVWDISASGASKTRGVLFSDFRTSLGLAALYQPLDADLTLFAAITPSANVQTLLSAASYAAFRTSLGLVIGTNVQAYDADLTTWAGITPSANVQTLLSAADYAAFRTSLALVIGTNVQAYDADLTTYAGITPSANVQSLLAAANYAAMRTLLGVSTGAGDLVAANNLSDLASAATARTNLGLVIGTNVQAFDADLSTYAGITPSANVQSLLSAADYAAFRTSLGLVIGTNVQAFDADLSTYAGITPSANVQSLLGAANYAAMRTLLGVSTGAGDLVAANNLSDLASAATARTNLGLVIGTNVAPVPAVSALSYGATITPAAGTVGAKIVHNIGALTGNPAFAAPTGTPVDGQLLELRLVQDATGGRLPTWNAIYSGVPTIPAIASARFSLLFEWVAAVSEWQFRAGSGLPGSSLNTPNVLYVTTTGSDATAAAGNLALPYATINAALDAASAGDVIQLGPGTFAPVTTAKMKSGIIFRGAGMPHVDSTSAPTQLVGGTIVKGPWFCIDKSHCQWYDLGVDSGSVVCTALYGGTAQDGLVVCADASHPAVAGNPAKRGMVVQNVIGLAKTAASAVHAVILENVIGAQADNIETWFGTHGFVTKATYSTFSNIRTNGHASNGVIIKANDYAECQYNTYSGIVMRSVGTLDSGGLRIHWENGGLLRNISIRNVQAQGTTYGVEMLSSTGTNIYFVDLSGVQVSTAQSYGIKIGGAAFSRVSDFGIHGTTAGLGIETTSAADTISINNGNSTSNSAEGVKTAGDRIYLLHVFSNANGTYGFNNPGSDTYEGHCIGFANVTAIKTGNAFLPIPAL